VTAPGVLLVRFWLGAQWRMLGVIPTLVVLLLLDKWIDGNYLHLKPFGKEQPSATAACVECGAVFDVQSMIQHNDLYVCARCKPLFLQRLAEGAKPARPGSKP